MMSLVPRRFVIALILFFVGSPAWAQFETGTVLGTVRDASGGVIPGVSVTLLSTATAVAATKVTDERGAYEFFTVRSGNYTVTAELSGFTTKTMAVGVEVGARLRVDMDLSLGSVAEAITVTNEVARLETDSSQRGQVITGDQTRALPLNGREYSSLALLTAGLSVAKAQVQNAQANIAAKRDVLAGYQKRQNDAKVRGASQVVPITAKVISNAEPSAEPVFPKKGPITLLTMTATMLSGMV